MRVWPLAVILSAALAVPCGAQPAPAPAPPSKTDVVLTTVTDERINATIDSLESGKLTLKNAPVPSVKLDDLVRIELENPGVLSVEWIGQDNHDVVQVGSAMAGNGIQDIHLRVLGLPFSKKLKQIVALCRYPGQPRVWRLDTSRTPHWRIGIERVESNSTAELFLEPNAKDAFGLPFKVTISFTDGTVNTFTVPATTHTSEKLAVGKAPAESTEATEPQAAAVYLAGGDVLFGKLKALGDQALTLQTAWRGDWDIPGLQVRGFRFDRNTTPERQRQFDEQLGKPDREDSVLVLDRDQAIAKITGSIESLGDGKLTIAYEGKKRSIVQGRVVAAVFAARPPAGQDISAYQVFRFSTGDTLSGHWMTASTKSLAMQTRWGETVELPRASVREILLRNGRLVYLSDVQPAQVEEVPYFSRRLPYKRDMGLFGGPLLIKGKQYAKGLAVHSRCVLTYDLDGKFDAFKCMFGFDDTAPHGGRVSCRVLADGKPVFADADVRADQPPREIDARIAGAKQLTLEVDFGQFEDIGDRVAWADARLLRGS